MTFKHCIISFISGFIGLFISPDASGQASVVSGSVSTSNVNYSPGLGNNRLLVVSLSNESAASTVRTVTSITWGGQALTFGVSRNNSGSGSNDLRAEIWYLNEAGINAAVANCNDFVVTWSGAVTTETFAVYTLKDVDQATPVAATGSAAVTSTTVTLSSVAVGINDIVCYASATRINSTHTPATGYTEYSDQVVGGTTALATASKSITVAGNETPIATWSVSNTILIAGVAFNGAAATGSISYFSRNATSGGNWDDNNSWTTNADGSGGPLAAGVWPRRQDNITILAGHTITIDATGDNKSCGVSPEGLGRSNVGPPPDVFSGSNVLMFYHIGDITVGGTLSVTGGVTDIMTEGYVHVLGTGTLNLTSNYVNIGYLEADASSTLNILDDFVLSGYSSTIINTSSTITDNLVIDHTDATLCGTGTSTLQNGAGSAILYSNSATVNQICSTFTINCIGLGCSGFPVTGTGNGATSNTGPGGVGNTSGTSSLVIWLDGNAGVTTAGTGISSWNDQSGYSNNATQGTAASRPTQTNNALNGFPIAQFDGVDDVLSIADQASIDLTQWSFLLVTRVTTHKNYNAFFVKGNDAGENYEFLTNFPGTGNIHFPIYYTTAARSGDSETVAGPSMSNTTFGIFQYDYDNVNIRMFKDMNQLFTRAENRTPQVNALPLLIGNEASTTGRNLSGDIAELAAFNAKLNLAQQIITNNYLSAKYAIALSANDIYTMDDPANGNYDFEVAGIGQANDGSYHKDARGSGIVRMTSQSPSSLSNGEFLIWGHDNSTLLSDFIDVDGANIKERLTRVWRLSETGEVGSVAVSFDISSLTGSPIGANLRLLIDRDGDGFADNDVTPVGGGIFAGDIITFTGVNLQNGDRFTLGNTDLANLLPIELISFTAQPRESEVLLTWSTASEVNNDFFTIQRSLDAEVWEDIVEVKGAGNSREQIDYETIDGLALRGVSYYRLKQTDFDKLQTYSNIKRVEVTEAFQLKVYPNPTSGSFRITTGFEILPGDVKLINTLGQNLPIKLQTDGSSVIVDTGSISSGIYILQVNRGFWRQSVRLVVE